MLGLMEQVSGFAHEAQSESCLAWPGSSLCRPLNILDTPLVPQVYTDYWKLSRKPFENSPDSRFLYYSESHRAALDHMMYAVRERKSLALLTGDYGCGKTTLVWAVAKALEPAKFAAGIVNNPRLSDIDLMNEILYQLGEDRQSERALEVSRMVADMLFRNVKEDKHTVVMIDEAQLIVDEAVLEQLRLLLNYQLEDRCCWPGSRNWANGSSPCHNWISEWQFGLTSLR